MKTKGQTTMKTQTKNKLEQISKLTEAAKRAKLWLEEYVNDTGQPQLSDSISEEVREIIMELDNAIDT